VVLWVATSSPPQQETLFIWSPLFLLYSVYRHLLRQKTGRACLYMPQNGYWLASFEGILPSKNWLFRGHKMKIEIPGGNCCFFYMVSALKIQAKMAFFLAFFSKQLSCRPRLSRTAIDPSRLTRPRPIDCDRGSEQPVKTFLIFAHFLFEHATSPKRISSNL